MRIFVKTIYIIGLLFWGGGVLCYSLIFIGLDGLGTTHLVNNAENAVVQKSQDSLYVYIDYSYSVGENEFHNRSKIWKKAYQDYNPDTLIVKYNKLLPSLNYIEQVPIKRRSYKIGITIFASIFLFNFLLWNLTDREKWFKKYESIGDLPKIYSSSIFFRKKR